MVNRRPGDLVELDPVHRQPPDGPLQGMDQVPRDGLPLAVGVGGQVDGRGLFGILPQPADDLFFLGRDDVARLKIVLNVHAHAVGRQVADVAHRGDHRIALTQETAHRARLGRRLDDDHLGTTGQTFPLGFGEDGMFRHVQPFVSRSAPDAEHPGAADGTNPLGGRAAAGGENRPGVLHLVLGFALDAVGGDGVLGHGCISPVRCWRT